MDEHDSAQTRQRQEEFKRRVARAAREASGSEPTEEGIVEAVRATREGIYLECYAGVKSQRRRRR